MKTYFVQKSVSGVIKIGRSKNVVSRISNLQCACEEPLVLLLSTNAVTEKEMHARFAADRVLGEWFKPDGILAVLAEIAELPEKDAVGDVVDNSEPLSAEITDLEHSVLSIAVRKAFHLQTSIRQVQGGVAFNSSDFSGKHLNLLMLQAEAWNVSPTTAVQRILAGVLDGMNEEKGNRTYATHGTYELTNN